MHPSLKTLEHRPWALPAGRWIMAQKWQELLFAHWPVATDTMRQLVPAPLELDCFAGTCWIGVVPFLISGARLRGMPAVPGLSKFPELNVRTYVKAEGKPGVWFFSLDAGNRAAVEVARGWFHLPYFYSRMELTLRAEEIAFSAHRRDRRGDRERFAGVYAAKGAIFEAQKGTLEHFLTERYCLYAQKRNGAILRSEIHHAPWQLQGARADFLVNSLTKSLGVSLASPPALLHFSKLQDVVIWAPKRVSL